MSDAAFGETEAGAGTGFGDFIGMGVGWCCRRGAIPGVLRGADTPGMCSLSMVS